MATFLGLCERLATRSGAIGAAPSSVTGQTGRQAKCVDWIANAWEIVQGLHQDWSFLDATWHGSLTAGNSCYTAAALGISARFGEWKGDRREGRHLHRPTTLYDPARGVGDEGELTEISYTDWRARYNRGSQTAGKPVHYAIAPDQGLCFGPVPDKTYIVRGEYRKGPQELASNSEEPDMPARFHNIIVDRALILINEHDGAVSDLAGAIRSFNEKLNAMQRDLLPDITTVHGR